MILHHVHDFPAAVRADDPSHGFDHEDLARLGKGHGTWESDHLVGHGIITHTPYLARHCRQNLVGSLPRGIPTVVDESVEVRVIGANISAETSDLDVFRPSDRCNTLCPMSLVDCIEYEMHSRGSLPTLYSLEGRVIGRFKSRSILLYDKYL